MSWNGSGVYSLPALYFPEAPGNLVDSDRYNGVLNDISTGLNVALTKNGQNTATANLPMGGFKHTGASSAASSGEYLLYGQINAVLGDATTNGQTSLIAGPFSFGIGQQWVSGAAEIWSSKTVNFGTTGAQVLSLFTNTTERMRLTSAGAGVMGGTIPFSDVPGHLSLQVTGSTVPLALRNNAATAGKAWKVGPDAAINSFVVYNQAGVGMYMTDGATAWTANSDERLKTPLQPFTAAVEKLSTLRAGTGRFLNDSEDTSRSFLIAQDVQKILPEAVVVNPDTGMLGLAYTDLIPLLVAAFQEVSARLEALEKANAR